jgi:hypothetical protein
MRSSELQIVFERRKTSADRTDSNRRRLELHRSVVNAAEPKHRQVLYVLLVYAPGRFGSLLRQGVERTQHVAGIEVDGGLRRDFGVVQAWGALRVAMPVHMFGL